MPPDHNPAERIAAHYARAASLSDAELVTAEEVVYRATLATLADAWKLMAFAPRPHWSSWEYRRAIVNVIRDRRDVAERVKLGLEGSSR